MRLLGRRGRLSLRGWSISKGDGNMNLSGRHNQLGGTTFSYSATQEWLDYKLYIIHNFIDPITRQKYDLIKKNFYNFDLILARLDGFEGHCAPEELQMYKQMVELMRYSTTNRVSFDEAQAIIYGGEEMMQMRVITSRIVLAAPYEIYNLLFGTPSKTKSIDHQTYEDYLILEIKKILKENPGILFKDIKEKMAKYSHKFTDASGCDVSKDAYKTIAKYTKKHVLKNPVDQLKK